MPEPAPGDSPLARRAIRIDRQQRAAALVVSLGLLGVASVAVLNGTDGTALLAFVAMGGLFALLAIVGVVPTRIRSGEHEMELHDEIREQQAQIEAAASVMDARQLEEAARQLEIPDARRNQLYLERAAEVERTAIEHLRRAVTALGGPEPVPDPSRRWDAIVQLPPGDRVHVSINYRLRDRALARILDAAVDPEVERVLVIVEVLDSDTRERYTRLAARRNFVRVEICGLSHAEMTEGLLKLTG